MFARLASGCIFARDAEASIKFRGRYRGYHPLAYHPALPSHPFLCANFSCSAITGPGQQRIRLVNGGKDESRAPGISELCDGKCRPTRLWFIGSEIPLLRSVFTAARARARPRIIPATFRCRGIFVNRDRRVVVI